MSKREESSAPLFTRGFVAVLIAQTGFGYAFSSFFLLPKFLATQLAAGPETVGFLQGLSAAASVAALLLCGVLVDRYGRKPFLVWGGVLMALASGAFAWVDSIGPLIIVLRVLHGIAFAMTFTAGAALAVDQAPPARLGEAIGLFGLTMLSMNAIAPAAVESIAARWGWDLAFGSAAFGGALCALLALRVEESSRSIQRVGDGILRVALRPSQLRVALVMSLVGTAFGAMFVYHQLFALELGFERLRGFFIAYSIAALAARLGLGRALDRVGRRPVAIVTLLLYATCAFGMTGLAALGLPTLGALLGFAHGLFYPAYNALTVQHSGPEERGKVLALFQAWFQVGNGGGTFALGYLAAAQGYPAVFVAAGAGLCVAWLVLISSRE